MINQQLFFYIDSYTLYVRYRYDLNLDIFYNRRDAKLKVCIDESIVKIVIDKIIKSR